LTNANSAAKANSTANATNFRGLSLQQAQLLSISFQSFPSKRPYPQGPLVTLPLFKEPCPQGGETSVEA